MSEVQYSSEMTVKLIRSMAADDYVVQAAQVSSKGENNPETVPERLIRALMAGGHGSPFEHNSFTFFVEVPLLVMREWQRHRIGSFNEMSGRYTELLPKFYMPNEDRKLVNVGTKMKPEFTDGASGFMPFVTYARISEADEVAWNSYQAMLRHGIANEVARMALPLNTYSQMYWTVNARSLMNFISLRVGSDESVVRSYPQYEIDMAARKVEAAFAEKMPLTHAAFVAGGRMAP